MSVRGHGEEVAKGGGKEGGELGLGEELEEGGFVVIQGGIESCQKLHGDGLDSQGEFVEDSRGRVVMLL